MNRPVHERSNTHTHKTQHTQIIFHISDWNILNELAVNTSGRNSTLCRRRCRCHHHHHYHNVSSLSSVRCHSAIVKPQQRNSSSCLEMAYECRMFCLATSIRLTVIIWVYCSAIPAILHSLTKQFQKYAHRLNVDVKCKMVDRSKG